MWDYITEKIAPREINMFKKQFLVVFTFLLLILFTNPLFSNSISDPTTVIQIKKYFFCECGLSEKDDCQNDAYVSNVFLGSTDEGNSMEERFKNLILDKCRTNSVNGNIRCSSFKDKDEADLVRNQILDRLRKESKTTCFISTMSGKKK